MLIVSARDEVVLELNGQAARRMRCLTQFSVVPGATHLFEEPGALERVADLALDWLERFAYSRGVWTTADSSRS